MIDYNPCDPRIHYVAPSKVFPYLGYCFKYPESPRLNKIWIDNTLRGSLLEFIRDHELYHLYHSFEDDQGFLREQRAYGYAIVRHPIGALRAMLKVLTSWERLIAVFQEKELKEGTNGIS